MARVAGIVWMDMDTKLPMRVDLLDRDGETLEQFRVIAFTQKVRYRQQHAGAGEGESAAAAFVPGGEKRNLTGVHPRYRKALAKFPAAVVRCRRWITCLSNRGYSDGSV